jgi:hypothetical protein
MIEKHAEIPREEAESPFWTTRQGILLFGGYVSRVPLDAPCMLRFHKASKPLFIVAETAQ